VWVVVIMGYGGFECFEYCIDWFEFELGLGEVLIVVVVCGFNNMDVNICVGWYVKEEGVVELWMGVLLFLCI